MQYAQFLLLIIILALLWRMRNGSSTLPSRSKRKRMVLDSCALIDGRIVELNRLGFVPDELIVPDFVIHELQMLADGNDSQKRERARFGLDVVKQLQDAESAAVTIDRSISERLPTDDKLVKLAKRLGAGLYTTDYNLNKVAEIEGVTVLNVNELAQELRPIALPGERKTIKILQKGSNPRQGVGYLEDGTMVVVDSAASLINRTVEVEITRIHQTTSGKMLFAHALNKPAKTPSSKTAKRESSIVNRLRQTNPKRPARRVS